ncbi:MAG: hypothetical protein ABI760_01105 [Ferruginibacter sp.]
MANQYIFLPWLRRGMAKQIAETDPLIDSPGTEGRAKVKLNVRILADDVEKSIVTQEVVLVGPGDITGIDRSAIVKTDPAPGLNNFEPNFFPYIEFYEEDFPWRYTPAKASGEKRLRPWISLIVLEEEEFERIQNKKIRGTMNIRIGAEAVSHALPIPEQSWAWAHVQVNEGTLLPNDLTDSVTRNEKIAGVLNNNPNLGVSRLMCPRKLKFTTKYYAFVVPAFEKGRLAGLGAKKAEIEAARRFQPSWSREQPDGLDIPVYYEWSFSTGKEDFEALAKKITPQDMGGTDVGRLWMDVSDINYGGSFDYTGNLQPELPGRQGFLPFEGALVLPSQSEQVPPGSSPPSQALTMRTGQKEKDFVKHFAGLINLGVQYRFKQRADLRWASAIPGNDDDDPLLVPPIYGRWYVDPEGGTTVDPLKTSNWLEQLNLDPSYRVAAGLGAEVVREFQEDYVSRAWEQLTDSRKNLNKELQRLRFAQEVTNATYKKHFLKDGSVQGEFGSSLLALTQSLHATVTSDDPAFSIAGKLNEFKPDTAFIQPAYRRLTRTNGPLLKRAKIQNAYQIVMVAPALPFYFIAYNFIVNPPFQNFNCSEKLINFNTNSFVVPFIFGFATSLQNPNWFGNNPGSFPIEVGKFPALVKKLQEGELRKPVFVQPAASNLPAMIAKVQSKILPSLSFMIRYQSKIPESSPPSVTESEIITPNSFNPFYKDPTYERLGNLKPELFIPNLDQVRPDSFVLLQANSPFIEAYLVGMNHELAGEFLWRGYPADMNATFFRQFWDKSDSAPSSLDKSEIQFIRNWNPENGLGTNGPIGSFTNPLVFVIKAELVKKYPNLVVYAQKAKMINGGANRVPDLGEAPVLPIFLSNMAPDYLFAGFPLTTNMVLGQTTKPPISGGYYFVIAERPGEVHFGLDLGRKDVYNSWNDLAWTDIPLVTDYIDLQKDIPLDPPGKNGFEWGKGEKQVTMDPSAGTGDAAQMAAILNQKPVRIFIHASLMVT